ncbi:ATP synthase subunit I [Pseudoalteromonas denitrificans]|uniref:ATP synthase protein I n=1 Tax=Pseudoalteromonas denitrificans DSM 6059 TaxID=1123010 RepID=A0A1I1JRQ9_9GAMM|nr:ATP synthase subunit I [Pseudoalteromonas denitrificans]SFC49208.1 ATP synthase protein I [Pseudoalteromonas denitrificans DSM 6059]
MNNRLAQPLRTAAFKLIIFQASVALIAAAIIFMGWGSKAGLSAVAGGFVCVIANLVFAVYAFRYSGARQANQVYVSFKRGSGLKFLLTIFLFALIFKSVQVVPLAFFACYILIMFMQWFAPLFFKK